MPRGQKRDPIIGALFQQGTRASLDVESLIEGYSSNAVADRSIAEYVERIAQNRSFFGEAGIARGEQVIELMVDRDLRRETEERIAEVR